MSNKKRTRTEITEEKKRRAIHLRNQGWFYRDIARDTGIPQHTIENLWKKWACDLGVEIITHGDDEDKPVEMPVTVSYVAPLPPINKRKEPVRPYTPSVIESAMMRMQAQDAAIPADAMGAADTEESSTAEEIDVDLETGSARVTAVMVEANEVQEAEAVQEEKASTKKAAASGRRMKRADQMVPPAGRKAPEPKEVPDLKRIYDLIGLINEAVVDYAIEMMVLPEQIGQSIEVSDGTMTMVLTVPVGGMDR